MLIIQGNRSGGMLGIHVGTDCIASGDAHVTSLIQPMGSDIQPRFVEVVSHTATRWAHAVMPAAITSR